MSGRREVVSALRASRPRDRFLRNSLIVLAAAVAWAWTSGSFDVADFVSERRLANLERFGAEVRPFPLQGRSWDWQIAGSWAARMFTEGHRGVAFEQPSGAEAMGVTLAISIVAIVLAGIGGMVAAFPAARTFSTPVPFLPTSLRSGRLRRGAWLSLLLVTRALLVFMRAIPEYLWAFLLIGMLGFSPWPAVIALAIHNVGVLGKLSAETIENLPPASLAALRGLGATRSQVGIVGALPAAFSRFLVFFFYRWETCVREATVLGMLGVVSLGYAISEARVRDRYDDMVFYVLLGALLVIVGDFVSVLVRRWIRRAA